MFNPKTNPILQSVLKSLNFQSNEDYFDQKNNIYESQGSKKFISNLFYQRPYYNLNFDENDFKTLLGQNWIADGVLNSYLSLCYNKISDDDERKIGLTNTFFLPKLIQCGCQAAACWQGIKNQPLSNYDLFLIPVQNGSHWILAVIDFRRHEIQIYDSFHGLNEPVVNKINEFLRYQGIEMMRATIAQVPSQHNGYDCGVFVMKFGRCIMLQEDIMSFSQKDIPYIRNKIYSELQPYLK